MVDTFEERRPLLRLLAAILYKSGPSAPAIADWLDVREATVYSWFDRIETGGPLEEAIRDSPRPGRPSRLDDVERRQFHAALGDSPEAVGIDAAAWTPRVARDYLEETFGVRYSLRHVRRLLR